MTRFGGWVLILTVIGAVVGVPILSALTLWLIYRPGCGWLRLRDRRPVSPLCTGRAGAA